MPSVFNRGGRSSRVAAVGRQITLPRVAVILLFLFVLAFNVHFFSNRLAGDAVAPSETSSPNITPNDVVTDPRQGAAPPHDHLQKGEKVQLVNADDKIKQPNQQTTQPVKADDEIKKSNQQNKQPVNADNKMEQLNQHNKQPINADDERKKLNQQNKEDPVQVPAAVEKIDSLHHNKKKDNIVRARIESCSG